MTPEQLCTAVVARLTEITPFIAPTVSHTEQSGDSTDWLVQTAIDFETGIMAYTEDGRWRVGLAQVEEDRGLTQGDLDAGIAAEDTDAAANFIIMSALRYYRGELLPPRAPDAEDRAAILAEIVAQLEASAPGDEA
ncbi:hypothetical protein [Frondihabitans australicus]|uniref:Uncharacterized protein n=1 Tax=Frondihabitans australicus TaxID=386892 RepID=A0A495IJG5_9MICO|nr:hypothetical protein [Frondihabitans australicus]RKR75265.1 hypothetical protein C8E83_2404 [Frondihabitans australicus]